MNEHEDVVEYINLQDVGVNTVPGVYFINGYGFAVVEQIEYPHERTNLRMVIDAEQLQQQEQKLQNALEEREHYLNQTIKLRRELQHENDNTNASVNGLPRFGNPRNGE